jgi:alkylhydroperoxidase family enzyme
MPRIQPKSLRDYPWYVRVIFWFQKRKYGTVLESAKFWGRSSRVFLGLSLFFGALERKSSPISPKLRSLIFIHISKIVKCPFCEDINSAMFIERKGNKDLLHELEQIETSRIFSKKEKAALKYAEAISHTPNKVTDALFAELQKHFIDDEIIELTALIAFQNCSSRFNTALEIPSQGFFQNR